MDPYKHTALDGFEALNAGQQTLNQISTSRAVPAMKARLTKRSVNRKTGPIPVSTTTRDTCPQACPLRGNGCYAEAQPLRGVWDSTERYGMEWADFCAAIAALPAGQLWRHNQAGDLPGEGDAIATLALAQLVEANKGRRGFTYTHKPVDLSTQERVNNNVAVQSANYHGFTVNLSADNLAEADELAALEIAPVVVVLHTEVQGNVKTLTPQGRRVVVCPATYRDDVTCASCQLCQRADRECIVGFPAHGASKRKASQIAVGE